MDLAHGSRPRLLVVDDAPERPASPCPPLYEDPLPKASGDRPTVMLVEDDRHVRALMVERLGFLDATIRAYPDAFEALAALECLRPELILSDGVMPGMDGFDFCRRVKADPRLAGIPFALLTSLSTCLRERSLEAGADDFLSKLETPMVFRLRIRTLLQLGVLREGGAPGPVPVSGTRILVLSSNAALQTQLRVQLADLRLEVVPCGTLPEVQAERLLRGGDLLLLDVERGTGPARETLLALAGEGGRRTMGVILMVGRPEEREQQLLEPLVDDRLAKPLDAHDLRHRVQQLVRLLALRGSLRAYSTSR